jgi:radical SAM protein with 4Fe4S-binding SPASM domain
MMTLLKNFVPSINEEFPQLMANNVFAIPIGNIWGKEANTIFVVYAPLNGRYIVADYQSVVDLNANLNDGMNDNTLNRLLEKTNIEVHYLPSSTHELYQIDILANYTCNFKCVYCYSAKGRSSKQIEFTKIKSVIDYLFLSGKKQHCPYIINFSGGGEPLISFELIKQTVDYIEKVNTATSNKYYYNIGLVTNGSLITPEIIDYLDAHNVNMAVSFEILKPLQDKERGCYDKVSANIDYMLSRDFPFGIRTTFTPESVNQMTAMIETVAHRFPKLKHVVFDTVLAPSLFSAPKDLERYYNTFIDEFYKAKVIAQRYGIVLESIAVETLTMIRDRTCEGKIVVTPMGTISSCARISSPEEKLYKDYLYGRVDEDDQLQFDDAKFKEILAVNNIYTRKECAHCFAKWNCGGGCLLFSDSFDSSYEKTRCDFARKTVVVQLLRELDKNIKQSKKIGLYDYVSQILNTPK